jgi:hypothetical protein
MEMRRLAGQEQLRDSVCAYKGESNESYTRNEAKIDKVVPEQLFC